MLYSCVIPITISSIIHPQSPLRRLMPALRAPRLVPSSPLPHRNLYNTLKVLILAVT
jgi:hypothetical protein